MAFSESGYRCDPGLHTLRLSLLSLSPSSILPGSSAFKGEYEAALERVKKGSNLPPVEARVVGEGYFYEGSQHAYVSALIHSGYEWFDVLILGEKMEPDIATIEIEEEEDPLGEEEEEEENA